MSGTNKNYTIRGGKLLLMTASIRPGLASHAEPNPTA